VISGLVVAHVDSVSLLAAGTVVLVPTGPENVGKRFLPQFVYACIRTKVGPAMTTSPTIRVGSDAGHANIAPNFTPPLAVAVGSIASLPLAVPLKAPPIDADLVLEIVTGAIGPSELTGDIVLVGVMIG
jgi:hypothetical protein